MTQTILASRLQAGAQSLGMELTGAQLDAFRWYYENLLEWNQRVNLTSVVAWEEVQAVHFLDSLTVALTLPPGIKNAGRILDVGAGAGFPGVPLKLALPDIELTLLEARGKKCDFLRQLVRHLGLQGVWVLQGRAEELAHRPGVREAFDVVLARALATMPTLAELTLPFAKVGGQVVAQKRGDFSQEVEEASGAVALLGGRLEEVRWVEVAGLDEPRALVILRKTAATPASYPRRAGIPAKRPLGSQGARPKEVPVTEVHHP